LLGDQTANSNEHSILQAIYSAYPDRLAKRRLKNDPRALMVGGKGVKLVPHSAVSESELFVAIDIDSKDADAMVRMASAVQRDWLDPQQISTQNILEYDELNDKLTCRKRTSFLDLVLDDKPSTITQDQEAEADRIMAELAKKKNILPLADSEASELISRINWLNQAMTDQPAIVLDLDAIRTELCQGLRSIAAIQMGQVNQTQQPGQSCGWLQAIKNSLPYQEQVRLDRDAPQTLTMPTGSKIKLTYELGKPPILAVRIQELFGMKETPRIANGRISVLLHLLAPNYRPQQVTSDLASFWENGYPIVRKELRGRYPKHSWPEDPKTAEPIRGPKKRTSE
jgi:ATP-dependent helicase HrpB